MNKLRSMEIEIKNCKKCHFDENKDARYCGGTGSDHRVMFVAESPSTKGGKGIFPAHAGFNLKYGADKLFFDTRRKFGFENCYLTDFVKCGIPSGKPTKHKVDNCINYLYREIKEINPKIIVAVGKYFYYVDVDNKKRTPKFDEFISLEMRKLNPDFNTKTISVDHYSYVYRYFRKDTKKMKAWEMQFNEVNNYL